jgi:hypothetical protein
VITAIVILPYGLIALIRPDAIQKMLADLSSPMILAALTGVALAYTWLRNVIFRTL